MWRCHCGESNLNAAARCRACDGARLTHEDPDYAPPPRERPRTVRVSFFGLGADAPRGGEEGPPPAMSGARPPVRLLSPEELAAHYARSRRQNVLTWIVTIAGALLAAALLAWQVMRPTR